MSVLRNEMCNQFRTVPAPSLRSPDSLGRPRPWLLLLWEGVSSTSSRRTLLLLVATSPPAPTGPRGRLLDSAAGSAAWRKSKQREMRRTPGLLVLLRPPPQEWQPRHLPSQVLADWPRPKSRDPRRRPTSQSQILSPRSLLRESGLASKIPMEIYYQLDFQTCIFTLASALAWSRMRQTRSPASVARLRSQDRRQRSPLRPLTTQTKEELLSQWPPAEGSNSAQGQRAPLRRPPAPASHLAAELRVLGRSNKNSFLGALLCKCCE